jgi:Icc-related predicted phosphoesterase
MQNPELKEDGLALCFFVSDLHGSIDRYKKLFALIEKERPAALFIGGDFLPSGLASFFGATPPHKDFINDLLVTDFGNLQKQLIQAYPRIFIILGNDDSRFEEAAVLDAATQWIWEYIHNRSTAFGIYTIYGYAYVPPTPFQLKDWERYDVSRYVDPGCISPEKGIRSVPVRKREMKFKTIAKDLEQLAGDEKLDKAIFLFHTPPYQTKLDRAALDGKSIDHVPLDVHVGSIAVRKFIETHQSLLTLHGHAHESARLTGSWQDKIGRTFCFSAAHDGPELALVRFEPELLEKATRELI